MADNKKLLIGYDMLIKDFHLPEDLVFQCFLGSKKEHYKQRYYDDQNPELLKAIRTLLSSPPIKTKGVMHLNLKCNPWKKDDLRDIHLASQVATTLNFWAIVIHLDRNLFLVPKFEERVKDIFYEMDEKITVLFEAVAAHTTPTYLKRMKEMGLTNFVQRITHTCKMIDTIAAGRDWGFCLDTAHYFANGQSLATTNKVTDITDNLKYVKLFHLNGTKTEFNHECDVHAIIGSEEDKIWSKEKSGLTELLKYARQNEIPIILERSHESLEQYKSEKHMLEGLSH
jgi:hypothetical protein